MIFIVSSTLRITDAVTEKRTEDEDRDQEVVQ